MKYRAEFNYYFKDTKAKVTATQTFEAASLGEAQNMADAAFAKLGLPLAALKSAATRPILPRETATQATESQAQATE